MLLYCVGSLLYNYLYLAISDSVMLSLSQLLIVMMITDSSSTHNITGQFLNIANVNS